MRFKRRIHLEHGILEQLNLIPFVDVIFQLLVFFMLLSSFTFNPGINVKLPKAVTSDVIKEENLIITITNSDVMYINNTVSTLTELKKELRHSKNKDRLILIRVDRRASVGRIVDVWDLCRNLGIEKINIATDQEN